MAYGNNRKAARPRSTFQVAGGATLKFRHPILTGQVSNSSAVDEIDVSQSVMLNDTFFDAKSSQDNAYQEVLVDGSVITITNHLLAGQMTVQAVRTTGLVGTGDFIAAAHLIIASKDSEGGTFTTIENIQGKRIITLFYGVSFKNVPHKIIAGNKVVPYPVVMNYAGWVEGVSGEDTQNEKIIWAVGNKSGIKAVYKPYGIQSAENPTNFYGGAPLSASTGGVAANEGDSAGGDLSTVAAIPATLPDGVSAAAAVAPSAVTWP